MSHIEIPTPVELDVYVCPLCLRGFTRDQISNLCQEHAPPKSIGGDVVTLTCRDCNSNAGPIQNHAVQQVRWRDFVAGKPGNSRSVQITAAGQTVNANLEIRDDEFYIFVDPTRSDPEQHDVLQQALDRAGAGTTMTLSGSMGFAERKLEVSRLRDAYLAAFALLGYRWALHPVTSTRCAARSSAGMASLACCAPPPASPTSCER